MPGAEGRVPGTPGLVRRGGRPGRPQISTTAFLTFAYPQKPRAPSLRLFSGARVGNHKSQPAVFFRTAQAQTPSAPGLASETWGTTDLNPPPRSRIRTHPPMNIPPFTSSTWPVIYAAASEARNFTACATSRSVPRRPSGICASIAALTFSSSTAVMGVSM